MGSTDGEGPLSPAPAEERNWAELPADVLSVIFNKIGAIEILMSAQKVCRPWQRLSREPQTWRCVDMTLHELRGRTELLESMAREAVDRSQGRMEEFSAEYFGNDDLLRYIADRSSILRSLCLISSYDVSAGGLAEVASKFPLLGEIEITFLSFREEDIKLIGKAYPRLKCFRMNQIGDRRCDYECDDEAHAVANTMHELRKLQLIGNRLANDGLLAILDNCPHLEFLDIRACFNVKVDQNLQAKFARIKDLRPPDAPTDDYPYDAEASAYGSFYDDYMSGNSEIDMMFDYEDMFCDCGEDSEDEYEYDIFFP